MDYIKDTIAAIATPPGRGGVGIVRISGPDVATIAGQLFGQLPKPRQAVLQHFRDDSDQAIDHGLVLYFPGPASFTGEDVLELQGHGGPVVMDLLLARVCALGARIARPGEFSERAFFNDKLDLAQAEAIADLIDSGTAEAARAAMRSLEGRFSVQVETLVEQLIQLRMYVEAAIDFPEEEGFSGRPRARAAVGRHRAAVRQFTTGRRSGSFVAGRHDRGHCRSAQCG